MSLPASSRPSPTARSLFTQFKSANVRPQSARFCPSPSAMASATNGIDPTRRDPQLQCHEQAIVSTTLQLPMQKHGRPRGRAYWVSIGKTVRVPVCYVPCRILMKIRWHNNRIAWGSILTSKYKQHRQRRQMSDSTLYSPKHAHAPSLTPSLSAGQRRPCVASQCKSGF